MNLIVPDYHMVCVLCRRGVSDVGTAQEACLHSGPLWEAHLQQVQYIIRAVYRIFAKGGRTWNMSKRGEAKLFVAAGQPQGGAIQGGARITQGGRMPPCPP